MRSFSATLFLLALLPATAMADAPVGSSSESDGPVCDAAGGALAEAGLQGYGMGGMGAGTCLSHPECGYGSACVYLGVCAPGRLYEQMTFGDLNARDFFTYPDTSCNYDTDCGPWVCNNGYCITPEMAGRPIYPRSNYLYYDTSCNGDTDCGAQRCIQGWCRDPYQATAFHGTTVPTVPTVPTMPNYGVPGGYGGMTPYTRSGYVVSCPSTWTMSPPDGVTDFMCVDSMNAWDGFQENCNVVFESTGSALDAYTYWNLNRTSLVSSFVGFMVNNERPVTVGGRSAYRVDYSHSALGSPMRVLAYFFTNYATGYVMTCTASPTSYYQYEAQFDQVGNSFYFTY